RSCRRDAGPDTNIRLLIDCCGWAMTSRTKFKTGLLRHSADRRTIAFLLVLSALYIAHWISGAHWLVLPCAVLAISACVTKHNHIHAPTFRPPVLNRGLNVLLALLTGTS